MTHGSIMRGGVTIVTGIALLVAGGTRGGAQGTKPPPDTSAKRIPIVKHVSGGDVVLIPGARPRVTFDLDSIDRERAKAVAAAIAGARADQHRVDSMAAAAELRMRLQRTARRFRADSALAVERAKADVRQEMRSREERLEMMRQLALQRQLGRGFYLGAGGGMTTPLRGTRDAYTGGWNFTVPMGWDATDGPLGVRTDFAIDHFNGTRVRDRSYTTIAANGDVTVWSLNVDAKLRIRVPGVSQQTRTHFYLLSGVGAHRVTGGVYGTTGDRGGMAEDFREARTRLGWNAGLGAVIGWRSTEIFMESRFTQVKTDLHNRLSGGVGTYTSFTPLVVGLNWF